MTLLALDMATNTGWCCGDVRHGKPVLGSIKLPSTKKDLGWWMDAAIKEYDELIAHTHPDRVRYESPILRGSTRIETLRKLYTLASVIEYVCRDRNIPVYEVAITTVKKRLTGNGRAQKEDMMKAAEGMGMAPKSHDEADAFGIWLTGAYKFAPEEALRFEDLLI